MMISTPEGLLAAGRTLTTSGARAAGPVQVVAFPPGCRCRPESWFDPPLPICPDYQPHPFGFCGRCEHDEACHAAS